MANLILLANRLLEHGSENYLKFSVGIYYDTTQILQGKRLSEDERKKLKEIDSSHEIPDYIFVRGKEKLAFLEAKDVTIKIKEDKGSAFQIKSSGWSASVPFSFLSNFEEFAIHDCSYEPNKESDPCLGRHYFTLSEYLDNFEILEDHLLKRNMYEGKLNKIYENKSEEYEGVELIALDEKFSKELSIFRLKLANEILREES